MATETDAADDDGSVSEFVCVECEIHVTALCLTVCPVPPRCPTCIWLEEFVPDPVEREQLARRLDPDRPEKRVH